MRKLLMIFSLLLLGLSLPVLAQSDDDIPLIVIPSVENSGSPEAQGSGGKSLTGNARLTRDLQNLHTAWSQNRPLTTNNPKLRLDNGRVFVMFMMQDDASTQQLMNDLPGWNGEVFAHYGTWVDAWVPVSALDQLANLPGVNMIRLAGGLRYESSTTEDITPLIRILEPQTGSVVSEGVVTSNADDWHAAGYTGAGINIAVIGAFGDLDVAQGTDDLPTPISVFDFIDNGTNDTAGTTTAEVVLDMAPDASLTINDVFSMTQFLQLISDLAADGQDVILTTTDYIDWPVPNDGTGPIADAVVDAQNVYDSVVVVGVSNLAQVNWVGEFCDCDNLNNLHEFPTPDGGWDEVNIITNPNRADNFLEAGQQIIATLRWSDWPTTDQDYDILLNRWDDASGTWEFVDWIASDPQTGTQPPYEFGEYTITQDGLYGVVIEQFDGNTTHNLELRVYVPTSDTTVDSLLPLEYSVPSRSLLTMAGVEESFTTSEVNYNNFAHDNVLSQGPSLGPGGVFNGGNNQPRISDYSGVSASAGTAFTGHVAGAVALVWQAFPNFTPDEVKTYLEDRAIDLGATGYDTVYGTGRLFLGNAPGSQVTETPTPETPTPEITPTPIGGCATPEWIAPLGTVTASTGNPTYTWCDSGSNEYTLFVSRPNFEILPFGTPNATNIANRYIFVTLSAADICANGVCQYDAAAFTNASVIWLPNDVYEAYLCAQNCSIGANWAGPHRFTLSVAPPVIPQQANATTTSITWNFSGAASNVGWLQIYLAPSQDIRNVAVGGWFRRNQICGDYTTATCNFTLPVTLTAGQEYTMYLQPWSPGGLDNVNDIRDTGWVGPIIFTP